MPPLLTGEGADHQVRVWPDKLSVCAPLLGRCGQEVGERCSTCTKDREQAAVLLCFWRTVRESCGGHQGTKDDILRVRCRPGGDMLVVLPAVGRSLDRRGRFGRSGQGRSSLVRSGLFKRAISRQRTTLAPDSTTRPRCSRMRIEMGRWTDQDSSRDSASGSQKATLRLTNEPLGVCSKLLSAASSAQHPPARSPNSPLLYDISQRSETRASPYNTLTQREGAPVPASLYSLFCFFSALLGQTPSRVNHLPSYDGSFIYRASTTGNVDCHCDIKALLICNSPARVVRVLCRVANMGGRACFRSPPPCSTGLPVLVVRARYPYSSSSLGAALRRPSVIGPAHIVSVSSHATAMQ